jgi:ABC-type branched-subunit amino acid transport system substrate-binding protein
MTDIHAAARRVVQSGYICTGPIWNDRDAQWNGNPDDARAVAAAFIEYADCLAAIVHTFPQRRIMLPHIAEAKRLLVLVTEGSESPMHGEEEWDYRF